MYKDILITKHEGSINTLPVRHTLTRGTVLPMEKQKIRLSKGDNVILHSRASLEDCLKRIEWGIEKKKMYHELTHHVCGIQNKWIHWGWLQIVLTTCCRLGVEVGRGEHIGYNVWSCGWTGRVRYIVPHGMVAIINLRYHIFQNCWKSRFHTSSPQVRVNMWGNNDVN